MAHMYRSFVVAGRALTRVIRSRGRGARGVGTIGTAVGPAVVRPLVAVMAGWSRGGRCSRGGRGCSSGSSCRDIGGRIRGCIGGRCSRGGRGHRRGRRRVACAVALTYRTLAVAVHKAIHTPRARTTYATAAVDGGLKAADDAVSAIGRRGHVCGRRCGCCRCCCSCPCQAAELVRSAMAVLTWTPHRAFRCSQRASDWFVAR